MITLGVRFWASTSFASVDPSSSVSWSSTMRTTFCAGVSESRTSAVMHFSLHAETNPRTTR